MKQSVFLTAAAVLLLASPSWQRSAPIFQPDPNPVPIGSYPRTMCILGGDMAYGDGQIMPSPSNADCETCRCDGASGQRVCERMADCYPSEYWVIPGAPAPPSPSE